MKKFLFLVAALLALGISTACADSDRPIDVAQLPQKAQQFIQKHFAGEKVALAKVERSRSTCPDTIPMRPSCRSTVTSTTTRSNFPTDWN